ncbi:PREDICTED: protein DMR6-LIKE OXYGENASE 2-like [Ipomoea nil]|uniref:protein DMR6-LIKE OXYGENASE 2-like n=1 Tax=Ipomoea nil TaxID=35883 RepID=UPI000900FDA4|nr:PREDICTED: protein DMR6-LIKE OXYGENASE 2-like [Ipomoea nil]
MAPAMSFETTPEEDDSSIYLKGVKNLCDSRITKVPKKYIFPVSDRPNFSIDEPHPNPNPNLNLPLVDFAQLHGPNRSHVVNSIAKACKEYGFFQVINHGIESDTIRRMIDAGRRFFDLPFEKRAQYMSGDMHSPVRCGTSFNQNKDGVFCWRDFLKLNCSPLSQFFPFWPTSPPGLREAAASYSKQTRLVYLMLIEAILESLGIVKEGGGEIRFEEFEEGSQLLVVNCYPACPEPELTLGMPPHSDYGLLTLLLQDEVKGLEIHHAGRWETVHPIPNSFVVNVGDHLEIFSNGRYKSVVHRVVANSSRSRISVASLHSLPFSTLIRPSPTLVDQAHPRLYRDTDFATFLQYISSPQHNTNFLDSIKLF